MRIALVDFSGTPRLAKIDDTDVQILDTPYPDLEAVIAASDEGLAALRNAPVETTLDLSAVRLLPPLSRFQRDILCTGWNYWKHFEEGIGLREGQEVDRPTRPTFFSKSPTVLVGSNDPIAFDPQISKKWDYEAELALVIGKPGRNIPMDKAMDHIFGYCLANDISQRDLQRAHGGQWLKGKSIDGTMPIGPWITLRDEIDPQDVTLECIVNGETLQKASTKQMAFSIPELIAELSRGMTLNAGDLVLTGTPDGVGNARDPQIFLNDGDEVIVRGGPLGSLENKMKLTDLTSYQ